MRHIPFISYRKEDRNFYLSGDREVNGFLNNLWQIRPDRIIAIG